MGEHARCQRCCRQNHWSCEKEREVHFDSLVLQHLACSEMVSCIIERPWPTKPLQHFHSSFQDCSVGLHIRFSPPSRARCNAATSLSSRFTARRQGRRRTHEELEQQQHIKRLVVDSQDKRECSRRARSLNVNFTFPSIKDVCKWNVETNRDLVN